MFMLHVLSNACELSCAEAIAAALGLRLLVQACAGKPWKVCEDKALAL